MGKIGVIAFCNMYMLPYAKIYITEILDQGNGCDLIFWNRDDDGLKRDYLDYRCKLKAYSKKITPESSRMEKLFGYIGCSKFIRKQITENKYSGLIFLQTHAACVCCDILKKYYSDRYIVDIRDYTLENIKCYRKKEKIAIAHSYATMISSPAYTEFLPEHNYIVAHNFTPFKKEDIEAVRSSTSGLKDGVLSISFIGTVRFIDMDKKILKTFSGDPRYHINYFGTGSEILENFCNNEGINNVSFKGSFSQDETVKLYCTTNIINNIYGNNDQFLDYALSNKLYHAAQFHMPILVSPKTYMEEVTKKYDMGYAVDFDKPNIKDEIYRWYFGMDRKRLSNGCDAFLKKVNEQYKRFTDTIHRFVSDISN